MTLQANTHPAQLKDAVTSMWSVLHLIRTMLIVIQPRVDAQSQGSSPWKMAEYGLLSHARFR